MFTQEMPPPRITPFRKKPAVQPENIEITNPVDNFKEKKDEKFEGPETLVLESPRRSPKIILSNRQLQDSGDKKVCFAGCALVLCFFYY